MLFFLLLIGTSFATCDTANLDANCATCEGAEVSGAKCLTCKPGFGLAADRCTIVCTDLCSDCTADKCTTCKANAKVIEDSERYCACTDGNGLNVDGACVACEVSGCAICGASNAATCDSCVAGQGLDLSNVCAACTLGGLNANCANCNGGDGPAQCTDCKTGFYKTATNTEVGACAKCMDNCAECAAENKCDKCAEGQSMSADAVDNNCTTPCAVAECSDCGLTKDTCTVCKVGFTATTDVLCDACPTGCDNCDGNKAECVTCNSGYTKDDTTKLCTKKPAKSSASALVFSFVGFLAMLF